MINVGMLRMLYRELASGAASLSSLTNRTSGIWRAAAAKAGAIALQGPHQAAQKSTTTGNSVPAMNLANDASLWSTGSADIS